MIPIDELAGRVTFIAGSGKNAGKTTLLVYLIRCIREHGLVCYGSAGLDGEQTCAVTGEEKPSVTCVPGDLVITSSAAVDQSRAGFELLEVFPWRSSMGRTVLAKTLRGGSVELVRPETNSRLGLVLDAARGLFPGATVLVDGAAGRLTQSSSVLDAGYVYTAMINPSNLQRVLQKIRLLAMLDELPEWTEADGQALSLSGAVTGRTVIPETCGAVVIEDHGRVFMNCREFEALRLRCRVFTRRRIPLRFCVPRFVDLDRRRGMEELRRAAPGVVWVGNPYEDMVRI